MIEPVVTRTRTASEVVLSIALLASSGCGASGAIGNAPVPSSLLPARNAPEVAVRRDEEGSWIAVNAQKEDLLYVSDIARGSVYIRAYPRGQVVGVLTGFMLPQGECVDAAGDVFVADSLAGSLFEYAHAGTVPIATYTVPNEAPLGCAIDGMTGNLAVTNILNASDGPGDVAVYERNSKTPTLYSDPKIDRYFFCAYDGAGNLYVDGQPTSTGGFSGFIFAELSRNSKKFKNINLRRTIAWPGGVAWDGRYIAVGDEEADVIWRTSGSKGEIAGYTTLSGPEEIVSFSITGDRVFAPDVGESDVGIYRYPTGGTAINAFLGFYSPVAAVLSKAARK